MDGIPGRIDGFGPDIGGTNAKREPVEKQKEKYRTMMMIPFHVIAFFLATLLLPADVGRFTVEVRGKTIEWVRQDAGWHAVELPKDDWGMYSVTGNVVTVSAEGRESKTDTAKYIALPANADWKTLTEIPAAKSSFGTPILIKREPNRITLSQEKGKFFESPAVITWVNPAKSSP